ncbi:MAG: tRNA (guanosine(37)-N1)-methyltransferase TrmD [Clostridia bacterium]|nr:tRNA (guanosine(37)-N1)-methyltransferase TrmD [Clostridia bacterium]
MHVDILTVFPAAFDGIKTHSIWGRAQDKGLLSLNIHDIRMHSTDKHRRTDDTPFGGGAGLVMTAQPVVDAVGQLTMDNAQLTGARRIYLSPRGKPLTHALTKELAQEQALTLLCGHYEGIDQRALDICGFEEISIGDYVLTGGEIPAMVLLDAVMRHIPGVLGCAESVEEESFSGGLLEYPHFTRPAIYNKKPVPQVLQNGNHADITRWRTIESLKITAQNRPDLIKHYISSNITIRKERPGDYRQVLPLTYHAFTDLWYHIDRRRIDEHYLIYLLKKSKSVINKLCFVAELNGVVVGHILYTKSAFRRPGGTVAPTCTFGPLSVLPELQRYGIGRRLALHSMEAARDQGWKAVIITGIPEYYPKLGFKRAADFGLTMMDGTTADYFMAYELESGYLAGGGKHCEQAPEFTQAEEDDAGFEAFHQQFISEVLDNG